MKKKTGSTSGLVIVLAIGFACYFLLKAISGLGSALNYGDIVDGIGSSVPKQLMWYLMNFTEPQFYASLLASAGIIIGGFVAWILAKKRSKLRGFDVCYGSSSLFPWVLASQLLSAGLAIFVYRYINLFEMTQSTWVATFITIVGAPPSIMLLYGPSVPALLFSSAFAGLLSAPVATWLSTYIIGPIGVPGVCANVLTMAIVGVATCMACKIIPWIEKKPVVSYVPKDEAPVVDDVYSAKWFVRRCLADFSEAQFYGNEVAGIFLIVGLFLDCIIMSGVPAYGGGTIPALLLSQFVGAAVGVWLYTDKFDNGGWYATYVPVVSTGPACVLMFGGSIPVAVLSGLLGGILGGPLAEFFGGFLPEDVHGTNANVSSMALTTMIVAMTLKFLGF